MNTEEGDYRRPSFKCECLKIVNCEFFHRSQFLKRNINHSCASVARACTLYKYVHTKQASCVKTQSADPAAGHGGCLLFPNTWAPNTLINVMTANNAIKACLAGLVTYVRAQSWVWSRSLKTNARIKTRISSNFLKRNLFATHLKPGLRYLELVIGGMERKRR